MTNVRMNLMELADIGGQPKKLAFEIHRQLRKQFETVPVPVPLEDIASSLGIVEIVDHHTEAFEGTLIVNGEKGAIALRSGMPLGRRRFTLGHEIGHFANPFHRLARTSFQCSARDVRRQRSGSVEWDSRPVWDRIEIEANEFSNALLLPAPEYRAARRDLGSDIDIGHIVSLAHQFGVSLEVMAHAYVGTCRDKIGIVTSHNGAVSRVIVPTSFPYLGLKKGAPLPSQSLTSAFRRTHARGTTSALRELSADIWLERTSGNETLHEQSIVRSNGHAMTLLYVDEVEPDEESDDRSWNRSNARWN